MTPPVRSASILEVEAALAPASDVDAEPSDDGISSLPSLRSSPDLPNMEQFWAEYKCAQPANHSPLPDSSVPSPAACERSISPAEESYPGQVYFYDIAGERPWFFKIPSGKGYFSLLNSRAFLERSRIVTHTLKVYDGMTGGFISLPPTAFFRQYSADHYLIVKEMGIADGDCPELDYLIADLDDPVDAMSKDYSCVESWRQNRATPSKGLPSSIASPIQGPSYSEQGIQTNEGHKRKRSADDEVFEPRAKVWKGMGDTLDNPIILFDN